jgi:capsular polysaccharide transport system permease protein
MLTSVYRHGSNIFNIDALAGIYTLEMSEAAVIRDQSVTRMRRLKGRFARINWLFSAVVVAPTILATVYFGLIASDVYISESRFVVRSPQRQAPTALGALLQGAGFSRSQDDTYSVHDFMLSRDALRKLDDQLALGKSFGSSDIDLLSRFNFLRLDDSFEALYRYYQKRVGIDLDSASSISVLRVNAFTAADSYRMNERLLEMGEQLINTLNERGRQDMIRFAASEVEAAEKKAKTAALVLSSYRNNNSVFDPERQSALQLQQVSKLQDELIATKTQLVQVRTFTSENPQIPALQKRVDTLQSEIDTQMAKVTGGAASLTNKAAEYERLALDRAFADKQLAAALASLEQARNDAQRKQLYLERIVQPNTPDIAIEPRRLRAILSTLVLGLIAWGILSVLVAGIREHHD